MMMNSSFMLIHILWRQFKNLLSDGHIVGITVELLKMPTLIGNNHFHIPVILSLKKIKFTDIKHSTVSSTW